MGMFLSQFSMLKALGYNEEGAIKEETEKILGQFSLFVFVLHDPEEHISFHHKFSGLFEKLDYLTGFHLLFIGLASPSIKMQSMVSDRDYYGIWEKESLVNSFHSIKIKQPSITCYSLATCLGIDYDDMPCLVCSNNLSSSKFSVIKTGETNIERQLTELGFYASSFRGQARELGFDLKELFPNDSIDIIDHYKPLAATFSDILAFSVPRESLFFKEAEIHKTNVRKHLESTIHQPGAEDVETEKLKLLTTLAYDEKKYKSDIGSKNANFCVEEPNASFALKNIVNYSYRKDEVESAFAGIKKLSIFLEPETRTILKTTSSVSRSLRRKQTEDFDYSPVILGLAKIFEIESNLSAVHWVRKCLLIELPEFYKKYKPDFPNSTILPDKSFSPNPKPVDFNLQKRNKWLAPGLGQSELVIKTLISNKLLLEDFSQEETMVIMEAWRPIREYRNRAAHSEVMSFEDLVNVSENFNLLIDSGNFEKLLRLKQKYKGTQNYVE